VPCAYIEHSTKSGESSPKIDHSRPCLHHSPSSDILPTLGGMSDVLSLGDSKPLYATSCAFASWNLFELGLVLVGIAAAAVVAAVIAMVVAVIAVAVAVVAVIATAVAAAVIVVVAAIVVVVGVVATAAVVDVVRCARGVVPIESAVTAEVMVVVARIIAVISCVAIAAAVALVVDVVAARTPIGVLVAVVAAVAARAVLVVRVLPVVSAACMLLSCGRPASAVVGVRSAEMGRLVPRWWRRGRAVVPVIVVGRYWRARWRRTWSSSVVVYGAEAVVNVGWSKAVGYSFDPGPVLKTIALLGLHLV